MFASRAARLFGLVAILALGISCTTGEDPTAPAMPQGEPELLLGLNPGRLLSCPGQPYAVATATIGPSGGQISVGEHLLVIPPGALSRPTTIRAEAPPDGVASVRLEPHGLTFHRPAELTLSYRSCALAGLLPVQVAYTTETLDLLDLLPSANDLLQLQVTAQLDHFSRYAVAW